MGRVSTALQRQEGLSLMDQDANFNTYANKNGHTIVQKFSFNESAGVSQKRSKFQEVISYIKANGIGNFYVENTTRLSRDMVDFQYIKDLYENHDVTFHFITENYTLNKNLEGASKMFLILRLMQGEMMIDDLKKKVKDTMLKKVERGEWSGRAPYGFKLIDKKLTIDEPKAAHVRRIFTARSEGATLREITDSLNKKRVQAPRGVKWHHQEIEKMLKQVAYVGQINWKGVIHKAGHTPIIGAPMFEKVQKTFAQTSRKNVKNAQLLSGMVRNPQGRLFTPEMQKGHVYYSAPGETKRVWLSEAKAFELIAPHIANMHWTSDFGNYVRETARDMVNMQATNSDKMIWVRKKELTELQAKARRVYDDRLDGIITRDLYQIKAAEIQARQVQIEQELNGLYADDRLFLQRLEQMTTYFETIPKDYAESENVGKAMILKDLCKGMVYDGETITLQYHDTFAVFINSKVDKLKRARVRDSSTMRRVLAEYRTLLAA